MSRYRRAALLTSVYIALLAGAFENVGLSPHFPDIVRDLSGTDNIIALVTAFSCASFVGAVVVGRYAQLRMLITSFLAASLLQLLGLVACAVAGNMATFVAGRVLQGLGEGAVTVLAFVVLTQLPQSPIGKSRALAGVSVAWLLATVMSPTIALALPTASSWRIILGILAALCLTSVFFLYLGRASANTLGTCMSDTDTSGRPRAERNRGIALLLTVGTGIILGTFGQVALALPSPAVAALAGIVIMVGVTRLLLTGRLGVAVNLTRRLAGAMVVRGAVSSLYFTALAFMPLIIVSALGRSTAFAAIGVACATAGWTLGAVAQTRLIALSATTQMSTGLALLGFGIVGFILTISSSATVSAIIACLMLSGIGSGITNNILPAFVAGLVVADSATPILSALETVDTVWSTVMISVVGTVVIPVVNTANWLVPVFVTYAGLGGVAILLAVLVAALGGKGLVVVN